MTGRGALAWGTGMAMLVAAWFVAWITPDGEERITDPFSVSAGIGERVEAGNLGVQVHSATMTEGVVFDGWRAGGTWLVVSLDAWLTQKEAATIGRAYLTVGDRTFTASERPGNYDMAAALNGGSLHVGVPRSGGLAFEIPTDAAGPATLRLAAGGDLSALSANDNLAGDAVITLELDLSQLERSTRLALPETEWTQP